jgi:hypothetical protein
VLVLDTTALTIDQTMQELIDWIEEACSRPVLLSAATRWAEASG